MKRGRHRKLTDYSEIIVHADLHVDVVLDDRLVAFDNLRIACLMLECRRWRVQGKFIVCSVRRGNKCTTEYGHKFLFGDAVPLNGDYCDLRAKNFATAGQQVDQSPKRTNAEMKRFVDLLDETVVGRFRTRALKGIGNRIKAADAVGVTIGRLIAALQAGKPFATGEKFLRYGEKILSAEIKRHSAVLGHIVLDSAERSRRVDPERVAALGTARPHDNEGSAGYLYDLRLVPLPDGNYEAVHCSKVRVLDDGPPKAPSPVRFWSAEKIEAANRAASAGELLRFMRNYDVHRQTKLLLRKSPAT